MRLERSLDRLLPEELVRRDEVHLAARQGHVVALAVLARHDLVDGDEALAVHVDDRPVEALAVDREVAGLATIDLADLREVVVVLEVVEDDLLHLLRRVEEVDAGAVPEPVVLEAVGDLVDLLLRTVDLGVHLVPVLLRLEERVLDLVELGPGLVDAELGRFLVEARLVELAVGHGEEVRVFRVLGDLARGEGTRVLEEEGVAVDEGLLDRVVDVGRFLLPLGLVELFLGLGDVAALRVDVRLGLLELFIDGRIAGSGGLLGLLVVGLVPRDLDLAEVLLVPPPPPRVVVEDHPHGRRGESEARAEEDLGQCSRVVRTVLLDGSHSTPTHGDGARQTHINSGGYDKSDDIVTIFTANGGRMLPHAFWPSS